MSASQPVSGNVRRPARLLTQNSEMRQIGVWNWSLPAWAGRLADGRTFNTCPSAGICAQACYARSARNYIYRKDFVAISLVIRDALRVIDRPIRPPELGTCPTSSV